MRTHMKIASLFLICMALTLEAHADQMSQAQVDTMRSQYFPLNGSPSINLHNAPVSFSDGAKGFTRYHVPENGWASFAPFASVDDRDLHAGYCSYDAIVRANFISSKTYLSEAKDTVITASDFIIIDVIKEDENDIAQAGSTIKVAREGGEIMDQGEKLRIAFAGRPEYITGQQYLLYLKGTPTESSWPFRADTFDTISIVNNRVYPSDQSFSAFRKGDPYDSIVFRTRQLSRLFACRR